MKKLLLSIVAALLLCLVLIVPAGATVQQKPINPPGTQVWDLDQGTGAAVGSLQMLREYGNNSAGATGSVPINVGQSITWLADESARTDVAFPSGDWIITLTTGENWNSGRLSPLIGVEVGEYRPAAAIDKYRHFATQSGASWLSKLKIVVATAEEDQNASSPDFTVHKGNYLYVKITNLDNRSGLSSHEISCDDGDSTLSSPESDPGYPVPELAAGVLFGLGLAGVGTFIVIRRKQGKAVSSK
jgi:hypothetical protein